MKLNILISLAAIMIACVGRAVAQTNDTTDAGVQTNANESRLVQGTNKLNQVQDIRVVNGQVYDVTTSKRWVSITIPVGSRLFNADAIHFIGAIQPRKVVFQFPSERTASQVIPGVPVKIDHFPYDSKYFERTRDGILTSVPLNLRVFPLSHPTTNWTALGEMKITPARPDFDYGLPSTNKVSAVH